MSPWDLVPIDEDRKPNSVGHVPVLPSEIVGTLYRPRPGDWGDERDSECNRISASLSQVMELAESEPFVSTNDLGLLANLCPYPMDLCTIKARLDNQFYRRASAVEFDVNYIVTNAVKFHHPKSNIVRSASVITDLCLEIIRNGDAVDVPAIYQQILEKYREERGDENADGPGTSEAAITSTTRTRSRRLTKTPSHHGSSGSRNPQPSKSHQSSLPIPSPPNPASSSPNDGRPYTQKNGKNSLKCNVCAKTFTSESQLDRHMRVHTGKRPFKCKICKKRFSQNPHLKIHMMIHSGEQPFSCHVCEKSFIHRGNLNRHLRVHTRERRYKCKICPKSFTNPTSLKKHSKKHQCDICLEKFSLTSDLKLHKRLHSDERTYTCRGCQKTFLGTRGLRNHWKTTNCEPHSVEGRSLSDSNVSDVEGNIILFCPTISTKLTKVYEQQIRRTRRRK